MEIHPDKTAERAVDACGGTYSAEQKASGYADGHFDALDAAMMAVRPVDALMSEMLAALAELFAMVNSECPSLLNEDSGGNSKLAIEIEAIISRVTTA